MAISLGVNDIDQLIGFDPSQEQKQQQQTQLYAPQKLIAPTAPAHQYATPEAPTLPAPQAPDALPDNSVKLQAPTPKQSVQAGMAQNGTDAKTEGKNQYEEMKPQVTAAPGTFEYAQQRQAQLDYAKAHPLGGDISAKPGVWGKLEHGLGRVANIAGDVLAPATTALIPGSDLNNSLKAKGNFTLMNEAAENELKQAQTADQSADAWLKLHPRDKAIGGPQITESGELMQEVQHANGAEDLIDLGVKGKPNVGFVTTYDNGQPTVNAVNKNDLAQAPQAVGAGKPNTASHTMVMTDPTDKKDYEYQYDNSGQIGPEHWKKIGPARPNAVSLGLVGTYQPQLDLNGTIQGFYNTRNPGKRLDAEGNPVAAGEPPAGTTSSGAHMQAAQRTDFQNKFIVPAQATEQSYEGAQEAMAEYNKGPQTGAAGMVLFAKHLGTTLASIKGAAIGEGAQQMHANAIGLADRVSRFIDYIKTGQPLSQSQMTDFMGLIKNTRDLQWNVAAHEAARRQAEGQQVKIDFLPPDVTVHMSDSQGHVLPVPGDKVQGYLDKGAKLAE